MIRESMLAVDRAIPFVLETSKAWFDADMTRRLNGVRTDIESLNQFEDHLTNKVQFLLDAVLGFIGIEQNDIFKVLTIASVVGIFPTLVAGWYGMNFHNMPEYNWTYGYQFGIGVIVLSTILPLAWFKWRGWM
jgi:magnesium transporter